MIAIINGCGANIASIQFALKRLGKESLLTTDIKLINSASHIILPGVGTAKHAMLQLRQAKLLEVISALQQPVLGICLGMQLLYEYSSEGNLSCLGILPDKIAKLPQQRGLTIPHMGWNQLQLKRMESPLLKDIDDGSYVYFTHSYAAPINDRTIAVTQYGKHFSAMVQNKNFYGVQFHPEKSGSIGAKILQNFLKLR